MQKMDASRRQLKRATVIYWLMLSYIVIALIWWFISLQKQSFMLSEYRSKQLNSSVDPIISPSLYNQELQSITKEKNTRTIMHLSEGLFFLALIVIAAVFIFRSVRRQLRVQLQQQNFMMAVTHELKTPIAVARLNLETMQRYALDPEKQKRLIKTTLDETSRLTILTNNILVASQLEGEGYPLSKEELDLSDLLKDCLHDFKLRFNERQFFENIDEEIAVKGDALLLQMLINNIIENAIRYSPKEKPIRINLSTNDKNVKLEIIDEGEGIPENEKKKIFNRFYRIGNEATRKAKGTGLGLYLCSKIAEYHNADISVTNQTAGGSNFAVDFHFKRNHRSTQV